MNCKFHPTAEAVATCASCGAGMCSSCDKEAFFRTENNKPLCLECSLKEAENELVDVKYLQKETWIKGTIASVIWFVGVYLVPKIENYGLAILIMLGASIFYFGKTLFTSDERGFFEKIKTIFWQIILCTLVLPLIFIIFLIIGKWDVIKAKSKVNKIKIAMGNEN